MGSLDSVVATVDDAGTFLYMNDVAAGQLGGAPRDFIGKAMHELFPEPAATTQLQGIRKAIREDHGLTIESQSLVQGQPRWYRTMIQPIHDPSGRPICALINSNDIHDLKTAQQELLDLNRTLEERVRERSADLRQANADLARAARAKDEFLATMSHELRTPLSAILGYSEILLEEIHGPVNTRQQVALQHIMASGQHLLALITDILDISKVEAGQLDLQVEPVLIAEACHASLLLVRELAAKKSLMLTFQVNDTLAQMVADPMRLKQMLVNLLANAVKFTPNGGSVRLEVNADDAAGVVRFAVEDTGIGIAPEGLARLFQPFVQLDSRLSRQHEGTGLGLALVRRLAELHGGSVTVESEVGRGSRFTIALPYRPPRTLDGRQAGAQPDDRAGE